jgi:hypothetical protein
MSFDQRVSFAVYLCEDSFPTKIYGYHFTNDEEQNGVLGREISNELSEIFWYFQINALYIGFSPQYF